MLTEMHIKSQKSRGSSNTSFGGPDTYVAITKTPIGQTCPKVLNHRVMKLRGIEFIYCGEGYSEHRGPRSMLGQAIKEAEEIETKENTEHSIREHFASLSPDDIELAVKTWCKK